MISDNPGRRGTQHGARDRVGEDRSPLFKDTPLVSEMVAPKVKVDYWLWLFASAGTPADILDRLHKETAEIMALGENHERVLIASMLTPPLSRARFTAKVARDWDDWGRVIREPQSRRDRSCEVTREHRRSATR